MNKFMILMMFLLGGLAAMADASDTTPAYTLGCVDGPRVCVAHLSDTVEHINKYSGLFAELNNAKVGETVMIYEHGYGGWTDTQRLFVDDVQNSKASVVFAIDGDAASADAYIALSGNGLLVKRGIYFMFHDVQIGTRGTSDFNNDDMNDALLRKDFQHWVTQHDGDLLSKQELDYMFTNPRNSVYISGEEMIRRWNEVRVDHQSLTDAREDFRVEAQ